MKELPPLDLLPDGVIRAAAAEPSRSAVSMLGREISYETFADHIDRFAAMLLANGVRRGDRIGLFAHKSIEVIVALFGIMRAGAVYVPINPDAPADYVRHIVDDCDITHLVAGKTTRKTVASLLEDVRLELLIGLDTAVGDAEVIGWDDVFAHDPRPPPDVSPDDLAYIIFTSGSTGRPKGIMHTHRSGLAYAEVAARTFGFEADDRIANHPPLNFDLSTLELFGSVVVGATLVIVPESHARLPASLSKLLQDERVTVLNAVPFALVQLLHRGALDQRDLHRLRWVLFGGEVYPTKDLRGLMRALPGARFGNVYGPAETNGVTYLIVPELPDEMTEPISIGGLYPGFRALVVDDADEEVPVGTAGELLINSPTQMQGYWNRPELTARSTALVTAEDGTVERWHRTGDLVERHPDGTFRLLGRRDRMVKTRGHRVELDEVETVLVSHGDVRQAVVYTVPDGEGSQRIEAVIRLRTERHHQRGDHQEVIEMTPDGADLKRYAAKRLPRYAVPEVIEIVDAVPLTSTGKADRVTLTQRALERN